MAKFSGDFWMGFVDGKPHLYNTNQFAGYDKDKPIADISTTRRALTPFYEDVRKVRIMEIK